MPKRSKRQRRTNSRPFKSNDQQNYVQKIFPDLLQKCNMFAGCSNGSILSSGMSFGYQPSTLKILTELAGQFIFTGGTNINSARYSNELLHILVQELFGETTMKDLKSFLSVPAVLLDDENPNMGIFFFFFFFFNIFIF